MSSQQIERVRVLCLALPDTTEKLSHGEPTFFVHDKVFVMFANNHHEDGHVAVWLPAPPGAQAAILGSAPQIYFKPPYVGARGWIGIELSQISDDQLALHINLAWELMAPKQLPESIRPSRTRGKRGARSARTSK